MTIEGGDEAGARRVLTLVVNPTSGQGRAARLGERVVAALTDSGFGVQVVRTTSIGEVGEAVTSASGMVAVLGGDGTIAAALDAAHRADRPIAPLPGGRGNDFCRALGIPRDPVVAARALACATERRVDAAVCGGTVVANVASIGYDGVVSELARVSRVPGTLSYIWAGVRALLLSRRLPLTVSVDGEDVEHEAWMVSVSSSGWFGGGKNIAPSSRVDDGLLEIVVAEGRTRLALAAVLVALLLRGSHLRRPGVTLRQGREVRVTATEPLPVPVGVHADGEHVDELPAVIRVLSGALRILA